MLAGRTGWNDLDADCDSAIDPENTTITVLHRELEVGLLRGTFPRGTPTLVMGYACPVCDDPQTDARHLANHLAFTAILGDAAHEAWLDEHAPGWADEGEAALADRVTAHAEEADYPQVFEDTVDRRDESLFESEGHAGHDQLESGNDHSQGRSHDHTDAVPYRQADVDVTRDEDTEAVLAEARELTRRMLADDEAAEGNETAAEAADDEGTDDEP